jgi:hypothetical protein
LPEVKAALKGARFPGRERDETEVRNHYLAFAKMEKLANVATPLQESEIQLLQGLMMTGKKKASPITTLILRRAGYGLDGIYSLDEH